MQVLFHPPSQKLISASEDGLVAVHDVSAGLDQDEGFVAALNIGTSVAQLGLYGAGAERMWCRTGVHIGLSFRGPCCLFCARLNGLEVTGCTAENALPLGASVHTHQDDMQSVATGGITFWCERVLRKGMPP